MNRKSAGVAVLSLSVLWVGSAIADRTPWTHLNYQNNPDDFQFAVGEVPPGETVSETECRAKMSGGRLCFWGGASGRGTLAAVRGFLERKLGVKRTGPGIEDVEFVQQIEMPIHEGEEWRFPQ